MLDALGRVDADPPENLRVEALVVGGGETTMQGMREFVRTHRKALAKDETWFVSFDSVGRGEPRFVVLQGPAVSLPMGAELTELFAALAGDGEDEERRAEPMRDGRTSAAFVARAYGYPAMPLTAREEGRSLPRHHHSPDDTPDDVDPAAIAAVATFAADAIKLLDLELGRRSNDVEDVEDADDARGPAGLTRRSRARATCPCR